MPAAEGSPNNGQSDPETAPPGGTGSRRLIVSEDLPLTLFIGAVTTVILSAINAVPLLLWLGVVLAPLVADVLKHWITARGWGKRRLLALTSLLGAGGTAERVLRGRKATSEAAAEPSASAILVTAAVSSAITVGVVTSIEAARDRALLLDRRTTFISARPVADDERPTAGDRSSRAENQPVATRDPRRSRRRATGFATPGAAIAATARKEGWMKGPGPTFTGRCPKGFTGGMIPSGDMCWFPDRDRPPPVRKALRSGQRLFTVGGYSFHEEIWLALERSAGRWSVTRIIPPPAPQGDSGPLIVSP